MSGAAVTTGNPIDWGESTLHWSFLGPLTRPFSSLVEVTGQIRHLLLSIGSSSQRLQENTDLLPLLPRGYSHSGPCWKETGGRSHYACPAHSNMCFFAYKQYIYFVKPSNAHVLRAQQRSAHGRQLWCEISKHRKLHNWRQYGQIGRAPIVTRLTKKAIWCPISIQCLILHWKVNEQDITLGDHVSVSESLSDPGNMMASAVKCYHFHD